MKFVSVYCFRNTESALFVLLFFCDFESAAEIFKISAALIDISL